MGVLLGGAAMVASAGALSSQRETDFYFTFNPTIGLSLSNSKLIIGDLAPGNAAKSNEIVLTVNSNNPEGFYLTASVGNSTYRTTELVNGSAVFRNTTRSGVGLTGLDDNTWGYTLGDDKYYGLPLFGDTPKTLYDTKQVGAASQTEGSVTFAIGAKAASTQIAGKYENVINFELVPYVTGNPTVTISAGTGGTVAASPAATEGKIPVELWTVVNTGKTSSFTLIDENDTSRTITATPGSGYTFDRWTTTCDATVSGNCSITANFKLGS